MPPPRKRQRSGASAPEPAPSRFLRVVHVGGGAPALVADASLLAAYVHPMPADRFKAECFGARPVAFLGGGLARLRPLLEEHLCGGDLEALAEATASERIHCWLRTTSGGTALESVKVDTAAAALLLHRSAGASLYHRAPRSAEEALCPALAEGLDQAFGAYYDAGQAEPRGEIEVFASRAGHVTRWHWDFQQNFTLQLSGSKTWRMRRGPVAPRRTSPRPPTWRSSRSSCTGWRATVALSLRRRRRLAAGRTLRAPRPVQVRPSWATAATTVVRWSP
jgi:hypothetical protein